MDKIIKRIPSLILLPPRKSNKPPEIKHTPATRLKKNCGVDASIRVPTINGNTPKRINSPKIIIKNVTIICFIVLVNYI